MDERINFMTNKKLVEDIIDRMLKKGYTKLSRKDYHREKRKFVHGCWRIDGEYYYFINFDEISVEEHLKQIKRERKLNKRSKE